MTKQLENSNILNRTSRMGSKILVFKICFANSKEFCRWVEKIGEHSRITKFRTVNITKSLLYAWYQSSAFNDKIQLWIYTKYIKSRDFHKGIFGDFHNLVVKIFHARTLTTELLCDIHSWLWTEYGHSNMITAIFVMSENLAVLLKK